MNVHKVYHLFKKKFFNESNNSWNYKGYEMMEMIDKWAKKYPKEVEILGIDDSCNASSYMVLINQFESKKVLWGTTVIIIPQCDGQPPCEFFLYPDHRKGITEAFKKLDKYKEA